jgi:methylmalonyl-CoA mutase
MFVGEGGTGTSLCKRWIASKTFVDNFDSVTLYGNDPHIRPDIYGKIGNAGVSICCLMMQKNYTWF